MAGKLGRSTNKKTMKFLGGGLMTRPSNQVIDDLSDGKMYATDLANVEYYTTGAVKKSTGWFENPNRPDGSSTWLTQAVFSGTLTTAITDQYVDIAWKVTPGSTKAALTLYVSIGSMQYLDTLTAYIYADAAGTPASAIAASNTVVVRQETDASVSSVNYVQRFTFNDPETLTSGTPYWIVLRVVHETRDGVNVENDGTISYKGDTSLTTAANVKKNVSGAGWTNIGASGYPYYVLEASTPAVQGLWDVRSESGGTIGQDIVIFENGGLYPMTTPSTPTLSGWDAALTGATALGTGQNTLGDYKTLNNLHFFSDYSTNIQRVWNGAATYTMQQGYRPTFSLAHSASAESRNQ